MKTNARASSGAGHSPDEPPDPYLERLCELAARDQWKLEELDWSSLDLLSLPELFRQTAADGFAQLLWGERTAELAASRLMELLPDGAARTFIATQRTDEARHVAFFERVIHLLGCEGRTRPSVQRLMREVQEAETPEELMLGMQILIEGIAHSLFLEAARVVGSFGEGDELDRPLQALKTVIGGWMPRLLARDESRHIAFGLHALRQSIPRLDRAERLRLEEKVTLWGALVLEQARDPDLVYGVGVDGEEVCRRLIDDLNLRIGQVGLETRIAPLKAA
ncbi:ferritin family protein [Hyalangium gracile]|uniref:ferritin-like domain-containing protein n=1 Tax=Hyalangium gracile TaxID=394092 RepID=UPI001CD03230|nr:ferritin-like domain-containing protein [Hyalangium gracile]